MKVIFDLLRIRQWLKNAFVLAPLFFSGRIADADAVFHTLMAFAAFCLASSAAYVFNDWRDRDSDKWNAVKRTRPMASGKVPPSWGLPLIAALIGLAFGVAWMGGLSTVFLGIVAIYLVANAGYSLGLRNVAILEMFMVALGFVLRVLAGGAAIPVVLSEWILIATATLALLITVGKRRAEFVASEDERGRRKVLDLYSQPFLDAALTATMAATLVAYLLFCASDYAQERYGWGVLLSAAPVAFGLFRYLYLVLSRGQGESPTELAIADAGLKASIGVFILIFASLIYTP